MRLLSISAFLAVFLVFGPARSGPAGTAVDLELVLGVDISGSVDEVEARLQREGYVAALTDPAVIAAIRFGSLRRIAVTYFEWSGEWTQSVVVDWTLVDGEASARRLAGAIAGARVSSGQYTSISSAIDYIVPSFGANAFDGARRVIDLSGDGPNNAGRYVNEARDDAVKAGITINGLPIVNQRPNRFGTPMPDLDLYYRDCVIGGPGAFIVAADDFKSFATAIRRKLILEIAGLMPPSPPDGGPIRPAGTAARRAPPCDEGERRLNIRLQDTF